jgi:hypothetical protein
MVTPAGVQYPHSAKNGLFPCCTTENKKTADPKKIIRKCFFKEIGFYRLSSFSWIKFVSEYLNTNSLGNIKDAHKLNPKKLTWPNIKL